MRHPNGFFGFLNIPGEPGTGGGSAPNHQRHAKAQQPLPGTGHIPTPDAMARTILFNKPFDVLSQFTDAKSPTPRQTLSDFINVPNVYPAGRLDRDSEGLLILTDDGKLQAQIANPKHKLPKTYLVQVEGTPSAADLEPLVNGITLKDGLTRPAKAKLIAPPALWNRNPPVRFRKSVPDSWISLTISEGKNRQVRRMTAAIGFPTLRLVRWSVGAWSLEGLGHGKWADA